MKILKPLFTPVDDTGWKTVIDFTLFNKGGISVSELLNKFNTLSFGRSDR